METADRGSDFLEHYGVKGMKWGVRRSEAQLARARGALKRSTPEPSEDKKTTESVRAKISRGNTDALSNAELQKLNERMQLEQKYASLTAKQTPQTLGQKFIKTLIEGEKGKFQKGQYQDTASVKVGKVIGSKTSEFIDDVATYQKYKMQAQNR